LVLEEKVAQLAVHLPICNVMNDWILFHAMYIEVKSGHGVTSSNLHNFENLST